MLRAIKESATANGNTPPPAIRPTGEEIRKSESVMVRLATPLSRLVAAFLGQAQRAVLAGGNECQDFRDCRVLIGQRLHGLEAFGKYAGTVEQLLIERANLGETLAGKLAALHADDVESLERGILAVDQAERNHVATHATDAADHDLRADPGELVHRRQAPHEDEIADLAMAAQRCRRRENDIVADLAIVTDVAAIHEIAAVADPGDATAGHAAGVHRHRLPDGAALPD